MISVTFVCLFCFQYSYVILYLAAGGTINVPLLARMVNMVQHRNMWDWLGMFKLIIGLIPFALRCDCGEILSDAHAIQ